MPQELVKVEASYLTPDSCEERKGEFALRRLFAGESTSLIHLCQKRNPRTGQVIETDEAKYGKLWLACSISDCPILWQGKSWKELDTTTRVQVLEKCLEEDMFVFLAQKARQMRRFTEETENLSEPQ